MPTFQACSDQVYQPSGSEFNGVRVEKISLHYNASIFHSMWNLYCRWEIVQPIVLPLSLFQDHTDDDRCSHPRRHHPTLLSDPKLRVRGMMAWRYIGRFDLFPHVDRLRLAHLCYHVADRQAMAHLTARYIFNGGRLLHSPCSRI